MTELASDIVDEKRVIADLRAAYQWRKSGAPLHRIVRQVPGAAFRFVVMAALCACLYALDHHTLGWAQGSGLFQMLRACLVIVAGVALCHFLSWRVWEALGPGFRTAYKRAYYSLWKHALVLFLTGLAVALVTSFFSTEVPPPIATKRAETVVTKQAPVAEAAKVSAPRSWSVAGAPNPQLLTHAEATVQCSVIGRLLVRDDLKRVRSELRADGVTGEFWMAEQRNGKFLVLQVEPDRTSTAWYKPREGDDQPRKALCIE